MRPGSGLPASGLSGARLLAIALLALLAGCASQPAANVVVLPSENQDSRVDHLVMHFTSETTERSLELLTKRRPGPVSAHYLITDAPVTVYQLVPETRRAWHAGRSWWAGENALNDSSIGIEIVNVSRCEPSSVVAYPEARSCNYLPFEDAQIDALIELSRGILERFPEIAPEDVVGHSDITPSRRVDPGPSFPWRRLAEAGIGAWPDDVLVERNTAALRGPWRDARFDIGFLQTALAAWGYDLQITGALDAPTRFALEAFQMHFRPAEHSGVPDEETMARLLALLEQFRPEAFATLALPTAS